MRKKLPRPLSIAELIPAAFGSWKVDEKSIIGALQAKWHAIVGPLLSRRTRPLSVRVGILRIQVENPSWANELQLLEPEILKAIRREVPALEVSAIRFR